MNYLSNSRHLKVGGKGNLVLSSNDDGGYIFITNNKDDGRIALIVNEDKGEIIITDKMGNLHRLDIEK